MTNTNPPRYRPRRTYLDREVWSLGPFDTIKAAIIVAVLCVWAALSFILR